MGHYLTPEDIRTRFVKPLSELSQALQETCTQWQKAHRSGQIIREELFLNTATALQGLGTLRKLQREIAGKLEDAVAGVYRYRRTEHAHKLSKRKKTIRNTHLKNAATD